MRPRIAPPLLLLLALFAIYGISRVNPVQSLKFTTNNLTAYIFVGAAFIIMLWAILAFKMARTTVDPIHPDRASTLVTTGPFRLSRNPMYLAMVFLLFAGLNKFGDFLGVPIFLIFLIYMDRVQIGAEEAAMRRKFGELYSQYCKSVRRWI